MDTRHGNPRRGGISIPCVVRSLLTVTCARVRHLSLTQHVGMTTHVTVRGNGSDVSNRMGPLFPSRRKKKGNGCTHPRRFCPPSWQIDPCRTAESWGGLACGFSHTYHGQHSEATANDNRPTIPLFTQICFFTNNSKSIFSNAPSTRFRPP